MILLARAPSLQLGPTGMGAWVSHKSERLIWGDFQQQARLNKGTAKLTKCPTQALSRVLNNLDICEVSACWKACGDREGKCARTFWAARVPSRAGQSLATMSPGCSAVPPAISPSQQPLNLLISKPGNKRRNSIASLPRDTLCVLLGAGDWGQWGQRLACLKNAGTWGGVTKEPHEKHPEHPPMLGQNCCSECPHEVAWGHQEGRGLKNQLGTCRWCPSHPLHPAGAHQHHRLFT